MDEAYRRILVKPPGLSGDDSARLGELLAAAVQLQQQLAAESSHVLQPVSGLQEDESSFYVEHEPARAIPLSTLFDPTAPTADAAEVLRIAAALADALRVTHASGGGRAAVHGGLCSGVLLESAEGIIKVADFGTAPAVCAVLGVDSYVNLAVGPPPGDPAASQTTGVWEVLPPDEYERDDRICSFIDPEKYGSGTLATFEPGSDIISTGFLLHLLAEHRHPYLDDIEDHRIVDLATTMAERPFNRARRRDFRESTEPAVQRWCEIVARMLQRLPRDRPTAAEVAAAFREVGVKPADASTLIEGHLKALDPLAERGEWDQLKIKAQAIASSEGATPETAEKADSFVRLADAEVLLQQASEWLNSDDWPRAQEPLDRLPDLSKLPDGFTEHAAEQAPKLLAAVAQNLAARDELDAMERQILDTAKQDASAAGSVLTGLLRKLEEPADDEALVAPLAARRGQLQEKLRDNLQALEAVLADHTVANDWLAKLEDARDQERWDDVGKIIGQRPDIEHWPQVVLEKERVVGQQFADQAKASAWSDRLRSAVEAEDWSQASLTYNDRPTLTYWPESLKANEAALTERLQDGQKAEGYIGELDRAVAARDWNAAGNVLSARPVLAHWPSKILERETLLRKQIEAQLKEQEREQLLRGEAQRLLQSAEDAAKRGQFEQALSTLDALSDRSRGYPSELVLEAEQRRKQYNAELAEKRRAQLQALAVRFVHERIARSLGRYVHTGVVDAVVEGVHWDPTPPFARGHAVMKVSIRGVPGQDDESISSSKFDFELDAQPPRVSDEDGAIGRQLIADFTGFVKGVQKLRAAEIGDSLRAGMFPEAEVAVALDEPTERAAATVHLLGTDVPKSRVEAELAWNPTTMTWAFVDAPAFTNRAVEIVIGATHELIGRKVLERSKLFRQYGSVLAVGIAPPSFPSHPTIPASLTLEAWLTIRQDGKEDRQRLLTFPVVCPQVGKVQLDTDFQPAETKLQEIVVASQKSARAIIERNLKRQIKAAPTKVKLDVLTKHIKHPVDHVQFELRPKHGDRLPLTAVWNVDTFDFEFPADTQRRTDELLRMAPAASGKLQQPAEAAAADHRRESPADRPRKLPRRALILVPVLLAVGFVGFVTVAQFLSSNTRQPVVVDSGPDGDRPKPAEDDIDDTSTPAPLRNSNESLAEVEEPTPPTPRRAPDEAIEAVRILLAGSDYLEDYVQEQDDGQDLVWVVESRTDDQLKVEYRLPGLENPVRRLTVTLDPDLPAVSQQDQGAVEAAAARLDALLDGAAKMVGEDVINALNRDSVDPTQTRFAADIHWTLDADLAGWSASNATLAITFTPAGDSFDDEEVEGAEAIELARLETGLEVTDGQVTPAQSELVRDLQGLVLATLRDRQSESLKARTDDLQEQTEGLVASVAVEPERTEDMQRRVNLLVETPTLKRRQFALDWDPTRLVYGSDAWQTSIDRLLRDHNAVRVMNEAIAEAEDHWIRDGLPDASGNVLFEIGAPKEDEWLLAARAPWAQQDPPLEEELLVIPLPIAPEDSIDDRVDAVLQLDPPPRWQLVAKYLELADDPFFLRDPRRLKLLVNALKDTRVDLEGAEDERLRLASYLDSDPQPVYVIPRMELVGKPRLSDARAAGSDGANAEPVTMELVFRSRFGLNQPDQTEQDSPYQRLSGVDLEYLDTALEQRKRLEVGESGTMPECTLTLSLGETDSGGVGVVVEWSDLAGVVTDLSLMVGEAKELNRLLAAIPERSELEAKLNEALGGPDPADGHFVPLEPGRAYELLQRIWPVKGAVPANIENLDPDLESFSSGRQKDLKRMAPFSKKRAVPTVFAEYFCGPRSTYAIVWSISPDDGGAIKEGPFLTHLCSNQSFYEAEGRRPAGQLGHTLLDPVLDRVREACLPNILVDVQVWSLGLALAPDTRMALLDLARLELEKRSSQLDAIDAADYSALVDWRSLDDLRNGAGAPHQADYALMPTLLSSGGTAFEPATPARHWAITVLDKAIREAAGGL